MVFLEILHKKSIVNKLKKESKLIEGIIEVIKELEEDYKYKLSIINKFLINWDNLHLKNLRLYYKKIYKTERIDWRDLKELIKDLNSISFLDRNTKAELISKIESLKDNIADQIAIIKDKNILKNRNKIESFYILLKEETSLLYKATLVEEFVQNVGKYKLRTLYLLENESSLSKSEFKKIVRNHSPLFVMMEVFGEPRKEYTINDVINYIDQNWESIKSKGWNFKSTIENKAVSKHTRFFRDVNALNAYKTLIIPFLKGKLGKGKILSLPCSEGREPYSIAILNEAEGYDNYIIDAFDISSTCLQRAKEGIYKLSTVKYNDPASRFGSEVKTTSKYMKVPANNILTVSDKIKAKVKLGIKDIFSDNLPKGKYDVIFSFNFLGQFSQKIRKIILQKFSLALKKGGFLILDSAMIIKDKPDNFWHMKQQDVFDADLNFYNDKFRYILIKK